MVNQCTQLSGATVAEPEYDPGGNKTAWDGKECVRNGENRLVAVRPSALVAGGEKAVFAYDCREFEENE